MYLWKKTFFVLCFCILSIFSITIVQAQWIVGAGGGFSSSPYKDYDTWTPIPIIGYNGEYIYLRGTQGGLRYKFNEFFTVSAFLEYDFTNFYTHNTDNESMEHLDNRYGSLLAGIGLTAAMPFGGNVRASIATNILDTHSGIVGNLEYDYTFRIARLMLTPSVGVKFHSAEYIDYYYGIDGDEAASSGLERYEVQSLSAEPYVGLRMIYVFDQNVSAMLSGNMRLLSPLITDSPMVDERKPVTFSVFGGISYGF